MNACCIICSDRFLSGEDELSIAAGKCGHTFHSACLDTWLANSSTCPKCRKNCSKKDVVKKLYFEYDSSTTEKQCESRLLNDLSSVQAKLAQADSKVKTLTTELQEALESKQDLSSCYEDVCKQLQNVIMEKKDLQKQLKFYQSCEQTWKDTEKECTKLRDHLQNYRHIERLVKDNEQDSKELVKTLMAGSGAVDRLANMCSIIKREYTQCKRSKKMQRLELDQTLKDLASLRVQKGEIQNENEMLKEQCRRMEEQLNDAEKREQSLRKKIVKRSSDGLSETFPSTSLSNQDFDDDFPSPDSSWSSSAGYSKERSSSQMDSKFRFGNNDSDTENNKQLMSFKMTSAATKKSRLPLTSSQSLATTSKAIMERSPQVPILQNFRRGYNGLGGHTTFTKSIGGPLRPVNASRKNSKISKKSSTFFL